VIAVIHTAERSVAQRSHVFDKQTLAVVNKAVMLSLVGSGFVACVMGALIYDVSRLLAVG
jgi:energy-converting hydrogenase Eha subunit C